MARRTSVGSADQHRPETSSRQAPMHKMLRSPGPPMHKMLRSPGPPMHKMLRSPGPPMHKMLRSPGPPIDATEPRASYAQSTYAKAYAFAKASAYTSADKCATEPRSDGEGCAHANQDRDGQEMYARRAISRFLHKVLVRLLRQVALGNPYPAASGQILGLGAEFGLKERA